ncbi:MAG: acyl-CoA dehydrogenase [Mycobacterium sp.]|nr:acyl-CoA dehydrogenase [Mycobacterium sp.]
MWSREAWGCDERLREERRFELSALAGGVFAVNDTEDDDAELRQLVDDIGRRSYDAGLGRRGVPDQFDAELWRNLEDTGLARLTSTPDMEAGPRELAVALYGVARHAGAVPLAESDVLAGWLGRQAGIDLPDGPLTVAIADAETEGARVTGTAQSVPWARACATVLAVRGRDGLRVGVIDGASGTLREGQNLAGEPRDAITFDVAADQLKTLDAAVGGELARRGAWSRCVQIIGALDAAAALSVEHTRQRIQFGRALSAFQSVQQSLAGMAGEIERARAAVELAVAAAAEHGFDSQHTDYAVTVAKIAVGRVVGPVTTVAHQLHGAIGVTGEHPLWLFTLRAQSWAGDYGTTNHFARRLGRMALAAADPWDLVTGDLTQLENNN